MSDAAKKEIQNKIRKARRFNFNKTNVYLILVKLTSAITGTIKGNISANNLIISDLTTIFSMGNVLYRIIFYLHFTKIKQA